MGHDLSVGPASFMMPLLSNLESAWMAAKRPDWKARAKGVLKAELARQGMSYADLTKRLAEIGIKDNELNIKNKIGRGSFTAAFLLQCLFAIDVHTVHLGGE